MAQLIIVCTAAQQDACNQAALQFDPTGGLGTFTVGLNASGLTADPATAYWCAFYAVDPMLSAIQAAAAQLGAQVFDGDTATPDQVLATIGLKRIGDVTS